ncbi:MAG: hypothetical protein EOO16_10915 [Chitinophagaceae bacterium]|nr:MAG: hypothetical protein EOO16_10915 [Chitinophagaceae bacterium]
MKKFFLILFASLSTLLSNATETPNAVLKSFQSTFSGAREVRWNENGQFFKANFVLDGQHINAYYNNEGEMVALTRNMTLSQLPVMLQADLKNKAGKDNWITDIMEYTTDEGTTYYATMENADLKITLRSASNSEWMTHKKIEKI